MSNSQLNKSNWGIKNGTQVILDVSSNAVGESNDETNFPHKLLLTNTKVSNFRKTFTNGSSANITFSQKLDCLRWYSLEYFKVDLLGHY